MTRSARRDKALRRAGKGVRLVIGNGAATAIDDGLASLITRAIATRNMFLAGRDDSIDPAAVKASLKMARIGVAVLQPFRSSPTTSK